MPEGDTIARAAAAMHRALAGRVVTAFATGLAPLARVDDDTPIAGRTVEGCRSVGKHLLIAFSGLPARSARERTLQERGEATGPSAHGGASLVLRTHMRMSGSWHLYRPGERWRRPSRAARVRIDTDAWVAVGFDVPVAEFVAEADLHRHRPLATLGPDLADPSFDRAKAISRVVTSGDRAIGDVLLDQRVVAGLGNVLRSETLFVAGVHPDVPASRLGADVIERLVTIAAGLLQRNARPAFATRNTTGRLAPGQPLWAYGRTGQPCRRCGTPIASAARGLEARRVYWCPRCQQP
jgi:endonuclease-8